MKTKLIQDLSPTEKEKLLQIQNNPEQVICHDFFGDGDYHFIALGVMFILSVCAVIAFANNVNIMYSSGLFVASAIVMGLWLVVRLEKEPFLEVGIMIAGGLVVIMLAGTENAYVSLAVSLFFAWSVIQSIYMTYSVRCREIKTARFIVPLYVVWIHDTQIDYYEFWSGKQSLVSTTNRESSTSSAAVDHVFTFEDGSEIVYSVPKNGELDSLLKDVSLQVKDYKSMENIYGNLETYRIFA
ncbi:hypothetical protein [Candidatus Uabimicrobium amorphum]|uniref:Uncharacterized protein n=1 Tax=Uabimicrobium amorphum TaxID=2596890 RepID=A0A5S9IMS7_UABAM|nr:hypothetical protein [Candidatus Uabimicrobium amorphum]BBM84778.1 hypothetical protein UABAM_03139 [Candidatus Uabimicrobium amorphum]